MAPEIWYENPKYYGDSADVFAMGVLLFIMRMGAPPFELAKPLDVWYDCLKT